jgi:hypothetical protein
VEAAVLACDWATCLLVLYSAVGKLATNEVSTGEPLRTLWRLVDAPDAWRPPPSTPHAAGKRPAHAQRDQPAGGDDAGAPAKAQLAFFAERTFVSATALPWWAYQMSGAWDAPGTLMRIDVDEAAARVGAKMKLFSPVQHEDEWVLPPFTCLELQTPRPVACGVSAKQVWACQLSLVGMVPVRVVDAPALADAAAAYGVDALDDAFRSAPKLELGNGRRGPTREHAPAAPSELVCPLCRTPFRDPVRLSDGKTYERAPLLEWLEDRRARRVPMVSPMDPTCRLEVNESGLPHMTEDVRTRIDATCR